ncbi:serologically defined colon cancer antigen 8 homolog [Rhopilema esculentum]|uniref:serologically defined colon cancer antigen 8 homolog n=1 Tax=Rhopilema esculentum TaxID=499914 RepID=UPI0031DABAF7
MASSRVLSLSNYERQTRDDAESSLDELRQKLEISPTKTPNRRNPKLTSSQSSPYSASVEKLKDLIHKYDKMKGRKTNESVAVRPDMPEPDELAPLLSDQHALLQHLEGQVNYYKEALSTLKQKAEIVIEENSRLHEQIIDGIQNEFSDLNGSYIASESHSKRSLIDCGIQTDINQSTHDVNNSTHTKEDRLDCEKTSETQQNNEKHDILRSKKEPQNANFPKDQPDSVARKVSDCQNFDNKIRRLTEIKEEKTKLLESLLEAARKESKEKDLVISKLENDKTKLEKEDILNYKEDGFLCIKCAHHEGVIGARKFGVNERVIKRMESENLELMEVASKQRKTIDELRRRETEAFARVKKSCEIAEEVQLEKQQLNISLQKAKLEIARMKEESNSQLNKSNELMQKEKLKLKVEGDEKLMKYKEMFEEVSEKSSKTEIQLDRAIREKLDLKATLDKLETEITAHDKEMEKKLDESGYALRKANTENALLLQENQRLNKEKKHSEKVQEQKLDWSNSELIAMKKRLLDTEQSLEASKSECLSLTEELQTIKTRLHAEVNTRNQESSIHQYEQEQMRMASKQQQQHLEKSLRESETKYEATKGELSSLLESQIQISKDFKEECKQLIEKQEKMEKENRATQSKILQENSQLKRELEKTSNEKRNLSDHLLKIRERYEALEKSMAAAQVQIQKYAEKAISLMNKYNSVLRERQLLREEVNFLKSQLPAFRHSDRISISDLDSTEKPTG